MLKFFGIIAVGFMVSILIIGTQIDSGIRKLSEPKPAAIVVPPMDHAQLNLTTFLRLRDAGYSVDDAHKLADDWTGGSAFPAEQSSTVAVATK